MSLTNKQIQGFVDKVCAELRFKSIHQEVAKELVDHIEDQKKQFMNQGLDEESAILKSVEEMGDPVAVGRQLNKVHRPRTEWSILAVISLLIVMGGAVQLFISREAANGAQMFSQFLLYLPMGLAAFAGAYFFDYTILGRYAKHVCSALVGITVIGLILVQTQPGGSIRYLYYFSLLFIPVFAGLVTSLQGRGYTGIIISGFVYGGAALITVLEPSITGLFLLTVCCLVILTVAVQKEWFGNVKKFGLALIYMPVIAFILSIPVLTSPYRLRRFQTMTNPEADPLGSGWLTLQIRRLMESSQFWGEATILDSELSGTAINQLLPGWSTDFLLTYLIARLGYIAGLVIAFLMLILIVRMFVAVSKQKNRHGYLISLGASLALTGQIALYFLSNTGVVPIGVTLPFISYGAGGFIVNMVLAGLVLSVYRRTDLVPKESIGGLKP
ncbi:FtsW/RodA/SpoVE family cell cycle protein [Dethiobacter alkaliphilus]|uniref:Cell cycle protein n=1 Tax=Dethiobacter alkaliphilus AHT 1 TaxID=555088 RepID=C0GK92_DETAL|nr:FtsW/RodA/SpoVE family cell cycle protein [Dethiobacter alkaliphilus]EEG76275.1 cell cycle protein [Dethiobacter alkaliphilus AHT 1]